MRTPLTLAVEPSAVTLGFFVAVRFVAASDQSNFPAEASNVRLDASRESAKSLVADCPSPRLKVVDAPEVETVTDDGDGARAVIGAASVFGAHSDPESYE
ncbi:hypothetical protein [Halocalculus aciditolerans]|uniref:hypothetical protein n=1 Tax=Halocalculus aciditolerans TaxID=1383812 RepID=UPI00166F2183|nr:hypothetical protein [Halocalculus aciditolerans]